MVYGGQKDTFLASANIDPEIAIGVDISAPNPLRGGGILTPIRPSAFDGSAMNSQVPTFIQTNPIDSKTYVYTAAGKVITYDNTLSNETTITTIGSSSGNGMKYYANYNYFATDTDISRYGPLDNSPSMTNNYWTSTLGKTALANNTSSYPEYLFGATAVRIPNHPLHAHIDNKLYIGDYVNGGGLIHFIQTGATLNYDGQTGNFTVGLTITGGTSGAKGVITADADAGATGTLTLADVIGVFVDNETITDTSTGSATVNGTINAGAGNDNSTYGALDLPATYAPTDMASWGNDLAILCSRDSSLFVAQSGGALFLWDTFSPSFYKQISIPDDVCTALEVFEGMIYIFTSMDGTVNNVYRYNGGDTVELIDSNAPTGIIHTPTLSGATASTSSVLWYASGLYLRKIGYNIPGWPANAKWNHTYLSSAISAVNINRPSLNRGLSPIIGAEAEIDKIVTSSGNFDSTYTTQNFTIGRRWNVQSIRFGISNTIAANQTITISASIDNDSSQVTVATINSTDYPSLETFWVNPTNLSGQNNFYLTFRITTSSTTAPAIILPILINVDVYNL